MLKFVQYMYNDSFVVMHLVVICKEGTPLGNLRNVKREIATGNLRKVNSETERN